MPVSLAQLQTILFVSCFFQSDLYQDIPKSKAAKNLKIFMNYEILILYEFFFCKCNQNPQNFLVVYTIGFSFLILI